jgi:conjugative transfer region lipoprotein (TIGR03751 family)
MVRQWTNTIFFSFVSGVLVSVLASLSGCASHIDKVVPKDQKNMKQIYNEKAGSGNLELLKQREADIRARPISNEHYLSDAPPHAAQIQHLFPALPNPELYMYVKPHVVGNSGVAVPAYMTRFTMYERTHYATPNEVVATIKHPGVVLPDKPPNDKKTTQANKNQKK